MPARANSLSSESAPVCIPTACFNSALRIGNAAATLRGAGLYEFLLFDIYSAAFYGSSEEPFGVPAALVLEFHTSVSKNSVFRATQLGIKTNPNVTDGEFASELKQLDMIYRDLEVGDRFVVTYAPGIGTTFTLNDEHLGRIDGDRFAHFFLGMWVSEHTLDEELRRDLLNF